jgi:hypothetical protein
LPRSGPPTFETPGEQAATLIDISRARSTMNGGDQREGQRMRSILRLVERRRSRDLSDELNLAEWIVAHKHLTDSKVGSSCMGIEKEGISKSRISEIRIYYSKVKVATNRQFAKWFVSKS